jgi:DNA-directed RNA polymerase subunit omega
MKGSVPLIRCPNRPNVASLREIAAGKVHFDRPSSEAIEEWIVHSHKVQNEREE